MNQYERSLKERKKCVDYMQKKKNAYGTLTKRMFEKQKTNVKKAIPYGKYFGNTAEYYMDELKLIDTCLAGWDTYMGYVK